nr:hypothetical protein CFP56_46750 [Quercus suber]
MPEHCQHDVGCAILQVSCRHSPLGRRLVASLGECGCGDTAAMSVRRAAGRRDTGRKKGVKGIGCWSADERATLELIRGVYRAAGCRPANGDDRGQGCLCWRGTGGKRCVHDWSSHAKTSSLPGHHLTCRWPSRVPAHLGTTSFSPLAVASTIPATMIQPHVDGNPVAARFWHTSPSCTKHPHPACHVMTDMISIAERSPIPPYHMVLTIPRPLLRRRNLYPARSTLYLGGGANARRIRSGT